MRQGPFCCEKAENKNKRTHTVVSTAIAVTITHASPPRLSQQENKTWGTNYQSATSQRLTGFYQASHWPFCTAWMTSKAIHLTASFAFPLKFGSAEIYCQWVHWLWNESWEAWTTVSSCIKHMTVTQHGWGPLRRAAVRGSWLVWRSTFFPCPQGYCKPKTPYPNTWYWSLMLGASLLLSVL